jgi:2-methylisocitrate lyase-like PEP mutase family enzyme
MDEEQLIKFKAQVSKVTTMADGSLRVVLDFGEQDIDIATKLMQVKQAGAILEVVALPVILDPINKQLEELAK